MLQIVKIIQQYITIQKRIFKNFKFEQQINELFQTFQKIRVTFIDIFNILKFY